MGQIDHSLDPRLRRLARTKDNPERLREDVSLAFAFSTTDEPQPATTQKSVLVLLASDQPPSDFSHLNWTKIVERIYTVDLPVNLFDALAKSTSVQYIEAGRPVWQELDSSIPEALIDQVRALPPGGPGLKGDGVVVGVIDFGLDFTLNDFRNTDGSTRVAFMWDQSLIPLTGEASPANHSHGVEYDAAAINAALASGNPFAIVRHQPDAGSHGTHVTSTAAGNGESADPSFPAGQFIGAAPEATIIFVQPNRSPGIGSFTDSIRIAAAIAYIFEKAEEMGMPCVVNMSLGQNGGSHDGESVVERAIDRHLETPGRAFVVAAGNEHVWRGHASGKLAQGQSKTLDWRVGGGLQIPGRPPFPPRPDRTPNELEIWYSSKDRMRVRLTDPAGNTSNWVEPGQSDQVNLGNDQIFIVSERFTALNGDAQIYIEMSPPGVSGTLQSGSWLVELEALDVVDGRFDAFIERDVRDNRNNFADQSFFGGTSFDPAMTLGTPATCRRGLAVANYDHRAIPQVPNISSSRGPARDGREKPEVAAPGTGIIAAHALGGRPNGTGGNWPIRVAKSGTSMAAPHVSGVCALMLEQDPTLSAVQIRAMLITAASPSMGILAFDPAWGCGRLDADAAINLV